jgi:hypothetical protein
VSDKQGVRDALTVIVLVLVPVLGLIALLGEW